MVRFKLALWMAGFFASLLWEPKSYSHAFEELALLIQKTRVIQSRLEACEASRPPLSRCPSLGFVVIAPHAMPSIARPVRDPNGVFWGAPLGNAYDGHPIQLTYAEAFQYCQSRGSRLPTREMLLELVARYQSDCPTIPRSLSNEPVFRGVNRFWIEDQEGLAWHTSRVFVPNERTIQEPNNFSGEITHPVLCVSE